MIRVWRTGSNSCQHMNTKAIFSFLLGSQTSNIHTNTDFTFIGSPQTTTLNKAIMVRTSFCPLSFKQPYFTTGSQCATICISLLQRYSLTCQFDPITRVCFLKGQFPKANIDYGVGSAHNRARKASRRSLDPGLDSWRLGFLWTTLLLYQVAVGSKFGSKYQKKTEQKKNHNLEELIPK